MHLLCNLSVLVALLSSVPYSVESRKHFNGDIVMSLKLRNQNEVEIIQHLLETKKFQLDFWELPSKADMRARVHVPKKSIYRFEKFLTEKQIEYEIEDFDIEKLIEREESDNKKRAAVHTYYMRHTEINTYLATLATRCGSICSVQSIGKSFQNRDMQILKIVKKADNPIMWIDAGIHAREWVAPATAVYLADKLADPTNKLLDKWSFYILPVANPDGYEYTHTNDRLWRKTRSTQASCNGVDGNRNFAYQFGGKGTSSSSCSDIYRGVKAFSEPETSNIKNIVEPLKDKIKVYWAVHSYGQYWLHPWGYDYGVNPSNVKELKAAGDVAAAALRTVNNRRYTVGHSADLLYPAAGGADDWARSIGIPYAYTLELPDTGRYGFVLPASWILSVGEETLKATEAFLNYI